MTNSVCANVDTTYMGELTAGRPRLARLTVQECPLLDLSSCYNSCTNTRGSPIALLGFIFLDIFAVSGQIFLKPTLLPLAL